LLPLSQYIHTINSVTEAIYAETENPGIQPDHTTAFLLLKKYFPPSENPPCRLSSTFVPKMDKDTPKILVILLDPVVLGSDMGLVEKAQDFLFQLAAPLPRDDFHQFYALFYCFLNYAL
jgi:hypothetical protein